MRGVSRQLLKLRQQISDFNSKIAWGREQWLVNPRLIGVAQVRAIGDGYR
jgi:hypothetical protein